MVTSSRAQVCLLCAAVVLSSFAYGATPQDRIRGPLTEGPRVALKGNMHGYAKPENDLGRADGSRLMEGVTLAFRPSPAQQQDLDDFLKQLANPTSPNYHKYLTPKQFGQRFGMTSNDLNKVNAWLESQGFTNIKVANGRNEISFDGTVAQVESTFGVEMHHYLVDGVVYLGNANDATVPAAIAGLVLNVSGLHSFAPKPRAARPHLTSYVSGSHFISPGDFASIDDVTPLSDGAGQKIAVIGQSTVNTADLNNFRKAAGLPASTVTMTLQGGTATRCAGDEGESDLDLEWAGGVAKGATIIFVYAGLGSGDTCSGSSRKNSVWQALDYAVQNNVAPFISTSYGFCEAGLGSSFAKQVQATVVQGQTQGQTLVSASGDFGAADCEPNSTDPNGTSATQGLAVDVPASIPEVTGAGGNEFVGNTTTGDPPGAVTGTAPATTAAATQYWGASGTGTDGVVTALGYIPEEAWNDTALVGSIAASGGGASNVAGGFFAKPAWQTGNGVPADGARDVPDISLSASPNHDGYVFCSEDDGKGGIVSTCTSGFRDGSGNFAVVGGTSVAAPTFSAILALINQYLGNTPPTGLAPVNGTLYAVANSTPSAFHDITSGDNMVPCTSGTTNCPSGTTKIGFSAGPGYDQVTGLGSVDAFVLAQAISNQPGFKLSSAKITYQVTQGQPVTASVNLTPINGFTGNVTYTCTDTIQESTCTGPTTAIPSSQAASFTITTTAPIGRLERPLDRGEKIFYASLFPGLLGVVFIAGSRKRSLHSMRFLGLLMVLSFSTIWLGSCGGSSSASKKDPGTPTGTYSVTVTGTANVNNASVGRQAVIQIQVVP